MQLRIVLVNPSHPGNIGAVARAIKNMGFKSLYLVAPKSTYGDNATNAPNVAGTHFSQGFHSAEARARASGAEDILDTAIITQTLDEAIKDCTLVLGLSSRVREIPWPCLDARAAAQLVASELKITNEKITDSLSDNSPAPAISLVFGQEQSGLLNEELMKCHYQVMINANPEYASLNLAQAVQILTYECRLALLEFENKNSESTDNSVDNPADINLENSENNSADNFVTMVDMEHFYKTLEQTLVQIEFLDPKVPRHLMLRLRRLFAKARPDESELKILQGWCRATQKAFSKDLV